MKKLIVSTVFVAPTYVLAAIPDEVTTQLASVKGDITTIGGLVIGLAAVAMGIRWVKAMFF